MERLLEEGAAGQPEATFFHAYNLRTLARKAASLNRESGPPAQMTKTTIFWPMGLLQQTHMDRHGFHGRKQQKIGEFHSDASGLLSTASKSALNIRLTLVFAGHRPN